MCNIDSHLRPRSENLHHSHLFFPPTPRFSFDHANLTMNLHHIIPLIDQNHLCACHDDRAPPRNDGVNGFSRSKGRIVFVEVEFVGSGQEGSYNAGCVDDANS